MTNPLDVLIVRTSSARTPVPPSFLWAVVQSVSPLTIRFDKSTSDLAGEPSTIVAVAVGDRVFVVIADGRATILGKAQ
jgi:hypothetical protein